MYEAVSWKIDVQPEVILNIFLRLLPFVSNKSLNYNNFFYCLKMISPEYAAMLENFLRPRLDDLFDEHGAKCVVSTRWCNSLHISSFARNVVSLRGDIGWPPRSPDLTREILFSGTTSKPRYTNIVPKLWKVVRRR
jgi:hypothetical protein